MEEASIERRKTVTMPQQDFEQMLERAAERGARHALHEVGLDGEDAAHDIRELRNLLDAFNEAKKTAGLTIIKMVVTGLVMAIPVSYTHLDVYKRQGYFFFVFFSSFFICTITFNTYSDISRRISIIRTSS